MDDSDPTHEDLYSIGDTARRTGLSVSAIRYYSDAGVIAPTHLTEAGYRLYGIRAIAQLELISTLRELGTGLDDIRGLLGGERTLHELLTTHLELVERQERGLRARRAVLRTLIRQDGTAAQASLMHRLVTMSDEERERLVDDFWNEVGTGLDVPSTFVERLRAMRPRLPEDPSAAQLEAWIELADLVGDPGFGDAVRSYLQDTYATPPGQLMTASPVQEFIHASGVPIMADLFAAHRSGMSADSPRAQELAARMADASAEAVGKPATIEGRAQMAAYFVQVEEILREEPEDEEDPRELHFETTHGRYLALVSAINGTSAQESEEVPFLWIAAALRASLPPARQP